MTIFPFLCRNLNSDKGEKDGCIAQIYFAHCEWIQENAADEMLRINVSMSLAKEKQQFLSEVIHFFRHAVRKMVEVKANRYNNSPLRDCCSEKKLYSIASLLI